MPDLLPLVSALQTLGVPSRVICAIVRQSRTAYRAGARMTPLRIRCQAAVDRRPRGALDSVCPNQRAGDAHAPPPSA